VLGLGHGRSGYANRGSFSVHVSEYGCVVKVCAGPQGGFVS
jgi:hypothetical protein